MRIILLSLCLVALLSACGGGGDEEVLTPYQQCVSEFVGPLRPGEIPAGCQGLEGRP